MKAIKFLNMLVDAKMLLEVVSPMGNSTTIDWLMDLSRRLDEDEDLVVELASWLALYESKPVPRKLKDLEFSLYGLRDALHA